MTKKIDPLSALKEEIKTEIYKHYETIEQFCFDHELNKATVSNFFSGKKDTQLSSLLKILKALDKQLSIK